MLDDDWWWIIKCCHHLSGGDAISHILLESTDIFIWSLLWVNVKMATCEHPHIQYHYEQLRHYILENICIGINSMDALWASLICEIIVHLVLTNFISDQCPYMCAFG